MLTFAFCAVVTERQEQGAVDWRVLEKGGKMLYSLTAAQFGGKNKFLIFNYMCNRGNRASDF